MDLRPIVFTGKKNRWGDLFDYASRLGFSDSDADIIAYSLNGTMDGMERMDSLFWNRIDYLIKIGSVSPDGLFRLEELRRKREEGRK